MRWISYEQLLEYLLLKLTHNRAYLTRLFAAHRYYPTNLLTSIVRKESHAISTHIATLIDSTSPEHFTRAARRAIILKTPHIRHDYIEKGVLLITFTETFPYFHNHIDCERLLRYFYIVLEPSWSGYCDPNILFWTKYKRHTVVIQTTEDRDRSFLIALKSNLLPISLGASDWVDHRLFRELPGITKTYDAVYVTNYNPIKRHHLLFKTLRELGDPTFKVALVFGKSGDAKSEIFQLVDYFAIRENLALYDGMPQEDLNMIFNRSKVNLLLSLKEGSNRSIFEGFFANVPGIVLRNNIGVKKDYVNHMTGRLINDGELAQTLLSFRRDWVQYSPRQWALQNISPLITTKKLSACLEKIARDNREPWMRGLVPKVNSPEVQYFFPEDEKTMPDSRAILSLFLKGKGDDTGNEDMLQSHLKRIYARRDTDNDK